MAKPSLLELARFVSVVNKLSDAELRGSLTVLRRILVEQLKTGNLCGGALSLLAHVQLAISAIDANVADAGPKERERAGVDGNDAEAFED